jgi:hypothetical protein
VGWIVLARRLGASDGMGLAAREGEIEWGSGVWGLWPSVLLVIDVRDYYALGWECVDV